MGKWKEKMLIAALLCSTNQVDESLVVRDKLQDATNTGSISHEESMLPSSDSVIRLSSALSIRFVGTIVVAISLE